MKNTLSTNELLHRLENDSRQQAAEVERLKRILSHREPSVTNSKCKSTAAQQLNSVFDHAQAVADSCWAKLSAAAAGTGIKETE